MPVTGGGSESVDEDDRRPVTPALHGEGAVVAGAAVVVGHSSHRTSRTGASFYDVLHCVAMLEEGSAQPAKGRRRSLVFWAVAVAMAAIGSIAGVVYYSGGRAPGATVERSDSAPVFSLPNVEDGGPQVSLSALAGRPVVINFWASWCVPCRREMPAFESVYEEVGDDVAFIGVNHQDSRRLALELIGETGIAYPSGYDPQGTVAFSFGLYGMPTTVFVDADGTILEQRTGELTRDELRSTIERLFGV